MEEKYKCRNSTIRIIYLNFQYFKNFPQFLWFKFNRKFKIEFLGATNTRKNKADNENKQRSNVDSISPTPSLPNVPEQPPNVDNTNDNSGNEVVIFSSNDKERPASFFAQPGILAGEFLTAIPFQRSRPLNFPLFKFQLLLAVQSWDSCVLS